MKTPITYYGGKQTLVKYLLGLIPRHTLYCEPFFGGGALFFAKEPSPVEVINDNNGEVVNFFRVMKMHFNELKKHVQATPHSRLLFKKAQNIYKNAKDNSVVERAWAFWTLANQGFSGGLTSWGFGKENSKEMSLSRKRDNFSTRKQLLDMCNLPDIPETSHCFSDSTHHTCCNLSQKAREYADNSGNPIGTASVNALGRIPKNDELVPWCTCTGSKVCSYYKNKFNDGTDIKFIGNTNTLNEDDGINKLNISRHKTPGIL